MKKVALHIQIRLYSDKLFSLMGKRQAVHSIYDLSLIDLSNDVLKS